MPFTMFLAGAAQRHALVQRDIVAYDRGLADDHAHSVVDEQPPPDLRAGMDFDAGDQAGGLGQRAGRELPAMDPQPMMEAETPQGVETRVQQHDFKRGLRRGIAVFHGGDVLTHGGKHFLNAFGHHGHRLVAKLLEQEAAQITLAK